MAQVEYAARPSATSVVRHRTTPATGATAAEEAVDGSPGECRGGRGGEEDHERRAQAGARRIGAPDEGREQRCFESDQIVGNRGHYSLALGPHPQRVSSLMLLASRLGMAAGASDQRTYR